MTERMRRVNEAVREALAEAIGELKDPRIGFVTVTGVETSTDLRQARVYVSVLGNERKREKTLKGLESAHGVLQARLASELRMKRTPQLTFQYDPTVVEGVRMSQLIDELAPEGRSEDERNRRTSIGLVGNADGRRAEPGVLRSAPQAEPQR